MTNKSLSERLADISQLYEDSQINGDLSYFEGSAYEIFEIAKGMCAENQTLLAKNGKLNEKYSVESALNVVAELEIEDLKAKVKELEGKIEIAKGGLLKISEANSDGYVFDGIEEGGEFASDYADIILDKLNSPTETNLEE